MERQLEGQDDGILRMVALMTAPYSVRTSCYTSDRKVRLAGRLPVQAVSILSLLRSIRATEEPKVNVQRLVTTWIDLSR